MKLALAQIDATAGDVRGNASRILEAIDEARAKGADVCVLPELAVVGYAPHDLLLRAELVLEAVEATRVIAREAAAGPTAILGTVEPEPGDAFRRVRNVAAVLEGGRVVAARAKTLLPSYDVFHETRHFVPAARREPALVAGRRLGLLVCEDMWDEPYAVHPPAELLAAGAERLVVLSASPYRRGVLELRRRHARRHRAPLVYVNGVGSQDDLIFDGGSFVLDGAGRVIASLPRFEECVRVVDLGAVEPEPEPEPEPEEREIFTALIAGIRGFARKNGLRCAFLGLSGGVDSALVAALAREALGPSAVHALALPARYTDPRSTGSARALAANLGIGFEVLPVEPLLGAAQDVLGPLLDGAPPADTTAENVQARLRALVLMAHVNRRGGFLLNTSNKTELALGYGTLYGDMAGGLAPIGDLPKTDVYRLARFYDRALAPRGPGTIPPFILERPPTAELRPDQVDPFDYDRVAPLAEAIVEGAPLADLVARGHAPAEIARLDALIRRAEPKRFQGPIVLKVAPTSFGRGRLVPVTNRHVRRP